MTSLLRLGHALEILEGNLARLVIIKETEGLGVLSMMADKTHRLNEG